MGNIRKQSTFITISSFAGGLLGMINKVLLFPKLIAPVEFGLAEMLVTIGVLYAQFSLLGLPNVILTFFPEFKDKQNHHRGFLFLCILLGGIGFMITTAAYVIFQPQVIQYYQQDAPLLVDYYYYGILFGLSYFLYHLFFAYLRSLHDAFVPLFVNEIVLRLFITACISLYAFHLVDFFTFVWIYTFAHLSMGVILILYTWQKGQFLLKPTDIPFMKAKIKPMIERGIFVLLGGFSYALVTKIDIIMLARKGLDDVAVYSVMAYFAAVLAFPFRALNNTTSPKIAESWKENDLAKISDLYKRVALLAYIAGLWLFCCIYINLTNIYQLIGRVEYALGTFAFIYLGIARLVDIMSGLNTAILITSKAFRFDLLINLLLLITAILTNYYFIFVLDMGLEGAAIATMLSIFLYNCSRLIFVYALTKAHPFTFNMLGVGIIGLAGLGIDRILPIFDYAIIDLIVRSFTFTLIFAVLIIGLNLSTDINAFIKILINDLRERFYLKRNK